MNKDILAQLVSERLTIRQIAKYEKTSATNVRYWLRKHKLKTCCGPHGVGRRLGDSEYHCGCGETDRSKFYGRKSRICGKCQNKYNTKKGQLNREKAIQFKGGKCVLCGYNKRHCALDLHHQDPTIKDTGFINMRYWSWSRTEMEIKKCILVCRNCHAEIHEKIRNGELNSFGV